MLFLPEEQMQSFKRISHQKLIPRTTTFPRKNFKIQNLLTELQGFWTFSIVWYSREHDVSETGCLRLQMKVGEKTPTQLGPLERANLNHSF
jgi:hypothetical protein